MTVHEVELPEKLIDVLDLSVHIAYRGAHGGRGSAKTKSFATALCYAMHIRGCNVLVCRELQGSIKDSSHAEIIDAIESDPVLLQIFDYGVNYIRHKETGREFIFRGLKNNPNALKGLANIGITWLDEADPISENSWVKLIPTVRRFENSEIWLTWNPEIQDNATDRRFIQNPPDNCRIVQMNHEDNPWFPEGLEEERQRDLKINPETYAHIWEGDYLRNSDAEIFANKWRVEEFEPYPDWQPYFGVDFGFSQDPTFGVEVYCENGFIYVRRECSKIGLDVDKTAFFLIDKLPKISLNYVQGDSARPETISLLSRTGIPKMRSCTKWAGSVEDGISFMRGHEAIIIHPSCKELIREMKLYRYKIDPNTADVTTKIVDAHNHGVDAVRYALDRLINYKNREMKQKPTVGLF